ncbi:MAG: hypothetical protein DRO05_00415 [Thermoproteota archaeon]|nr:MAG: hypothetical protein DRO05_00415 [Candidatus Korarchaeota archaeon]
MTSRAAGAKARTQYLLIELVRLSGHVRPVSSRVLARKLGISKATMSRWLREAYDSNYISIERGKRGEYLVKLNDKGYSALRGIYSILDSVFSVRSLEGRLIIKGRVFTGMGEGAYYVTRKGYLKAFEELLGKPPFPGTLNLRISSSQDVETVRKWRISCPTAVYIPGFKEEGRTFGFVIALPVIINNVSFCYAIYAERRHYGDEILEIISDRNLREELGLRDGDVLTVQLLLERPVSKGK